MLVISIRLPREFEKKEDFRAVMPLDLELRLLQVTLLSSSRPHKTFGRGRYTYMYKSSLASEFRAAEYSVEYTGINIMLVVKQRSYCKCVGMSYPRRRSFHKVGRSKTSREKVGKQPVSKFVFFDNFGRVYAHTYFWKLFGCV